VRPSNAEPVAFLGLLDGQDSVFESWFDHSIQVHHNPSRLQV
jgi:hypothetical protein